MPVGESTLQHSVIADGGQAWASLENSLASRKMNKRATGGTEGQISDGMPHVVCETLSFNGATRKVGRR